MPNPAERGLVYFISADDDNSIVKIGMTTRCAFLRMADLQTGYPYELHLIGVTRGGQVGERFWHKYFAASRLRGEWFDFTDIDIEKFLCECENLKRIPALVKGSLPVEIGVCSCAYCALEEIEKKPELERRPWGCMRCNRLITKGDICNPCQMRYLKKLADGFY